MVEPTTGSCKYRLQVAATEEYFSNPGFSKNAANPVEFTVASTQELTADGKYLAVDDNGVLILVPSDSNSPRLRAISGAVGEH